MRRPDAFISLVFVLVAGLAVTYYYSQKSLGYFEQNISLKKRIEQKRNQLDIESRLKEVYALNSMYRSPASIDPDVTVDDSAADLSNPEAIYKQIKSSCYDSKQDQKCMSLVNTMLSQYPGSDWCGKTLLILGELFLNNSQPDNAKDVVLVVKQNFKDSGELQKDALVLERAIQ